nr:tRNA (N(6)-L-threonylcarbamoyladenosine(37)-C(2))-methylthiotransferase MtaB [Eubacterium sp.]
MKVAFLTLGCKVNYYETERMMADFQKSGFEIVEFQEKADVYVINTCTVTNIADRKSRKMLHRAKKMNPNSIVVAVGCYVESGGEVLQADAAIDVSFSNKEKENIAEKVLDYLREIDVLLDGKELKNSRLQNINTTSERTRKYIKIQDGCNQFCSYCLIPYVRGKGELVSRKPEEILDEIRKIAEAGYKEIVVTGIHLSSYGVEWDQEPGKRISASKFVEQKGAPLIRLLQKVDQIQGIERIRLGSLEPRIICREFVEGLKQIRKLCPHFHLSLQSGCDDTLKRMNRHYTTDEFRETCELLRQTFEHPAITTDVIVGFPGETEEEFETTRNFVKDVALADIHVFPYSVRTGTKAATMANQISPDIKHKRTEILMADTAQLKEQYETYFIHKEEKVLFEEIREVDGGKCLVGHNERYVMMQVPLELANQRGYRENDIAILTVQPEFILKK